MDSKTREDYQTQSEDYQTQKPFNPNRSFNPFALTNFFLYLDERSDGMRILEIVL